MIRLGFVGAGGIQRVHAAAAQSMPGVDFTAVVNHDIDHAKVFADEFKIPNVYPTVEDLIAAKVVDAVIISTPNFLHAHQTIAALFAGYHVMVEKPMAMNAVEAQRMVDASRSSGTCLMVAHCYRYEREIVWLREQIASGILGNILRTRGSAVHVNWGPSGWFTQARYAGGGAVIDMGVHAIDTVRFLLNNPLPVSVFARIGTYYKKMDVDDTGLLVINWDNGITSVIEAGWWQPHADGPGAPTQIYGTKGYGQVYPSLLKIPVGGRQEVTEVDPGFAPRDSQSRALMYQTQMTHFIDCIQTGKQPVSSGEEGLATMKVVDAAYQSSRDGTLVSIP